MTWPVSIHAEARAELREAIAWYEREVEGLGAQFHAEMAQAMARLRALPGIGTPVPGIDPQTRVRRVLLSRFPYSIVFRVDDERLVVLAFAHSSRAPAYWASR